MERPGAPSAFPGRPNGVLRPAAAPVGRFPGLPRPEPAARIASTPSRPLLTATQLLVLDHLADGCTRAQVGARMNISPNSVGTYLTRMGRKLEHHSQSGMVGYCYHNGLFRRRPSPLVVLSARGTWLACMVAEGRSNQEIAVASGVSLDTAKYQVRVLMHTLGARSRPHVVRRAVDAGALLLAWWGGAR